jgi:hypothetical protein
LKSEQAGEWEKGKRRVVGSGKEESDKRRESHNNLSIVNKL